MFKWQAHIFETDGLLWNTPQRQVGF